MGWYIILSPEKGIKWFILVTYLRQAKLLVFYFSLHELDFSKLLLEAFK
jgi:hypothetical protein